MSELNHPNATATATERRWVEPGVLYVVATPIGNLADLSERALSVLRTVDRIACEDTRHARRLLDHYGIRLPLMSAHEHNEAGRSAQIAALLAQGEAVALISDAGTPAISDPGSLLVRQVRAAGHRVVPVPGPSALIAALSASGLDSSHFRFEGFLPPKAAARQARLAELATYDATLIFYEAPHRIVAMMTDLANIFGGQRSAAIGRELTKRFEQIVSGPLQDLVTQLNEGQIAVKGEFVVLVEGMPATDTAESDGVAFVPLIDALLAEGVPAKGIAKALASVSGRSRNQWYQDVLDLKQANDK